MPATRSWSISIRQWRPSAGTLPQIEQPHNGDPRPKRLDVAQVVPGEHRPRLPTAERHGVEPGAPVSDEREPKKVWCRRLISCLTSSPQRGYAHAEEENYALTFV